MTVSRCFSSLFKNQTFHCLAHRHRVIPYVPRHPLRTASSLTYRVIPYVPLRLLSSNKHRNTAVHTYVFIGSFQNTEHNERLYPEKMLTKNKLTIIFSVPSIYVQLTIYSSRILCLSSCLSFCHPVILSSCHPVTIAEGSAILLVLIIKLTQETRRRVWRGRDMDGEIGKGFLYQ